MNRLERLLNLLAALLDASRPLSRAEIEQLVPGYEGEPASVRRAFERDKDTLRSMGIPIAVEPLDPRHPELGEGYRVRREQYQLPDLGLTADELAALHLAAGAVRMEGASVTEALWKLGGVPGGAAAARDIAALPGSEHVATLFGAVGERRQVRFRYRGEDRTVDPYRLSFRNGFWYLSGFDHARGEQRSYRVDRLQSPPVPGEPGTAGRPAAPLAGRPVHPWEMGDEEVVTGLVLVDADQAPWAVAKLGEEAVAERRPDGGVVLRLRVTNRDAFRSFVLGFLDHAEVLGPDELRADMVSWLEALAS